MSNSYFRFKKFTVYHDKCAMKVGTDGVLLGGWTIPGNAETVLDIGTGTGLIALMLVQKSDQKLYVDAIDIDENATIQANENILRAGTGRINCIHTSLQQYTDDCKIKYDLIVTNPPYFSSSLHSPNTQRTLARHTDSLSLDDLIRLSAQLLSENGRLSLIFPYSDKGKLIAAAQKNGLHVSRLTNVYPTLGSQAKRILVEFSSLAGYYNEENLVIEEARHIYTSEFIKLVKDFYLKL